MSNRAWDMIDIRNRMQNSLEPTFGGMISDPNKRGYSSDTKAMMRGKIGDSLAGARTSFISDLDRQAASQGMSNTGMTMRNLMNYDRSYGVNQANASRDVELQDAEAKRQDLWSALSGSQNLFNSMENATANYAGIKNSSPSFWNSFKTSLGSQLGGTLGGGGARK